MDEVSFKFRRVQTIQPTHPTVLHLVFQNLKFHIIPNPLMQKKTAISKHHQQNHPNFLKKNDLKKCASNVGIDCGSNFLPNVSSDSEETDLPTILKLNHLFPGNTQKREIFREFFDVLQNDPGLWKLWGDTQRGPIEKVRHNSHYMQKQKWLKADLWLFLGTVVQNDCLDFQVSLVFEVK